MREAIWLAELATRAQDGGVTRAEVARRIGVARTVLADWERDGVVQVERDDRGVPMYQEVEVQRLSDLLQTGQLVVPPPARAPKSGSPSRRRPPSAAVTELSPIPSDDVTPETMTALAPATDNVAVSATDTATLQVEDADDAVKRIRLAAVIARADLERIQAVALRDEAVRLLTEAARGRRLEYLVGATLETVLPFEREAVDQILRQRLVGSDLEDSFALRAVIAGAVSEARVQLAQQRAQADRIAAERRAAAEVQHRAAVEAQQRAAAARAADDARRAAEQQAHEQAAAHTRHRAFSMASAVAAEAASHEVPPWVVDAAGCAAWYALSQVDLAMLGDDIAFSFARAAGQQGAAAAWQQASMFEPPSPFVFDDEPRRRRGRRQRRR